MQFFKKTILGLLTAASMAAAQFSVGGHVGGSYNMWWNLPDGMDDAPSGLGFNAGVEAKIAIPMIAVVPGVLFSYSAPSNDFIDQTIMDLDIPVMVRFSPLPLLFVQAGPQLNFNLKYKEEYKNEGIDDAIDVLDGLGDLYADLGIDMGDYGYDDSDYSGAVEEDPNTVEFGLTFGIGVDLPLGLTIDFRYFLGLNEFIDEGKVKRMNMNLGVTYWFL